MANRLEERRKKPRELENAEFRVYYKGMNNGYAVGMSSLRLLFMNTQTVLAPNPMD